VEREPPRDAPRGEPLPPFTDEQLEAAGVGELARALAERGAALARAEIELARREATSALRVGRVEGGIAVLAGVLFTSSLCCGLVAAILAIGAGSNPALVALFGCALFVVLGAAVAAMAYVEARRMRPERSLRQAKATAELLRHPTEA
jgi:hypothetical protein